MVGKGSENVEKMKKSKTFGNLREPSETFGDLRKPSETIGECRKPSETFENLRKSLKNCRKKLKIGMNEVGFRFHELSLGQVKALDCGNGLGPILAKNSRKTGEKSRLFPLGGGRKSACGVGRLTS